MSTFVFRDPNAPRRTVLGLATGVGVAGLLIAVALWSGLQRQATGLTDLRDTIARGEAATASQAQRQANEVSFYIGDTPQLAQTEMQSDMQALAEDHGLKLEVIRADAIEDAGSQIRLGLILNGVIPEANLGTFMTQLEAHRPMILVDEIDLRRARTSARNADTRPLAMQLKLSGFAER
ncbi:type II secretion system protein GspM [Litoreibacter roseus]|uniref:Type II secretion system (T2SS), protein M subtype b n=1 Tax=Litoreibacter roseus TaxID=2601869 RepID=A0A6N6JKC7_9RHOB|nr:type II secretion system protein GspM [Litoreibacter roseus]GFE66485.1 hypothetical protein KIN_35590 [Litoreibacter roseus]